MTSRSSSRCRCAALILPFVLAAAEATPTLPEIPDPYGLGPRLALIAYLRDELHVAVEPGATYETLVAQYQTAVAPPADEAAGDRLDRVHRLQYRLKSEFAIVADDCGDEAVLQARLAECERRATVHGSGRADGDAPATAGADPAPLHARGAPVGKSAPPTSGSPAATPAPAADNVAAPWFTDYQQAVAAAKASGKPILIDFTGSDWCGWCKKLDHEVFGQMEFSAWAAHHVVLLVADFPRQRQLAPELVAQNTGLAKTYHITGFPTIVVIDANGRELGRGGYLAGGVAPWVEGLGRQVKALRDE